jgi:hypothetical protein
VVQPTSQVTPRPDLPIWKIHAGYVYGGRIKLMISSIAKTGSQPKQAELHEAESVAPP